AMYDMMKNPYVPLKDILYRQYLLGGAYLAYDPSTQHAATGWEDADYHQKTEMIAKFYDYVQQNHGNGYAVPWSTWLKKNP
ncbi:MAG: protein tyrosine phosphatase, partial [Selenomonas sp.]|nr:protein tyrosine phosphatase [Selenomonas sp.]